MGCANSKAGFYLNQALADQNVSPTKISVRSVVLCKFDKTHVMEYLDSKPPTYFCFDTIICDVCQGDIDLNNLQEKGFYHCNMCEYDICKSCC